jgi:hypothetical protein
MSTSAERYKTSLSDLNLIPAILGAVVFPQVVQLAIVIVLSTEAVQFIVVDAGGAGCANLGLILSVRALLEYLSGDGLGIGHGELGKLVDS